MQYPTIKKYSCFERRRCTRCGGTGYEDLRSIPDEKEPCPDCEGLGSIRAEVDLEEEL
jgi:DnaJ-class molecular chaperone